MHIFLIILNQYKNYNDETIASSSPLISNFNESSTFFFLFFEHSWSLLFFVSQTCSFTLHLKFLTIATLFIYIILIILETIVCNEILFKFEDNRKQTV